jgi:hypothetical protein
MSAVQLEIPEETLISLKTDAESFGHDLKIPRVEFLLALRRFQVSPLQMTAEELRQDVLNA